MRLKIAAVLVILGLLAMGAGVGQRTIWEPPETITSTVTEEFKDAPLTVLEHTLNNRNGEVQLTVEGEGQMMLAVGRAKDVKAWVGDAAHLTVLGYNGPDLVAEYSEGSTDVPSPRGSDMWQTVETGEDRITYTWADPAPGRWSILLASEDGGPAPTDVSLTVPNAATTPWSIPLIVIGALLTVLGLAMLFGPKKDKRTAEPVPGSRAARRQSEARSSGRSRSGAKAGAGRRSFEGGAAAVLTLCLVGGLGGAAGATQGPNGPDSSSSPGAGNNATTTAQEGSAGQDPAAQPGYPVLLEGQLQGIMDSVAGTVETADAAKNAKELKTRVAGPALEQRTATYQIQSKNSDYEAPTPIAAGPIMAEVITSTFEWPRTVVAVTQAKESEVPQALVLVQEGPRENYKLRSAVEMLPGTTFPQAADDPAKTTTLKNSKRSSLVESPESAMAGLADVLANKKSKFADRLAKNTFVEQITTFQKEQIKANKNADISFKHTVEKDNTRALRTADGGALVFGYLSNSMTSTPTEDGGTVELDEDYAALAGGDSTETGVTITFGESIMMYVPPAGSEEKVQVIGAAQNLVDAKLMKD